MKQTTYITAKQNPVNPPEVFASILASHFTSTYKHIHKATVKVIQHRWARLSVDGKPHPHSFYRDGSETRNAEAIATSNGSIAIRSSVVGLLVLKSTGSAFHGFIQDEFTILKPTDDRILSTEVDAGWSWKSMEGVESVKAVAAAGKFDTAWEKAREITLNTFATDSSPSVQNTMYKMCEAILGEEKDVEAVDYSLPNKHYFEIGEFLFVLPSTEVRNHCTNKIVLVDLSWHKGLKNTGKDVEVYAPQTDPNGLIQCKVTR